MWNKLFKKKEKKQSKPINKSIATTSSDATNQSASKCFTFRTARQAYGDQYKPTDNFHYLQYESEAYRNPGEASLALIELLETPKG